jgi:CheY-like chemotaxis protein
VATVHSLLYIEDNLANLTLIARILASRDDVKLITAMQAHLGVELAREHVPDLILLDLHLPDMPGEETLRELQRRPSTRGIPVVILSADATPGQVRRLMDAGAHDYLTKPLDVARFIQILDSALAPGEPVGR